MRAKSRWTIVAVAALLMINGAHAQADTALASTVGELVRIEAQRALVEARKSSVSSAALPQEASQPQAKFKMSAAPVTDVLELVGIYRRESEFAADIALNGSIRYVKKGERLGNYTIKGIGDRCVDFLDSAQVELKRCVAMMPQAPM
jgi:hypothetical protein